jgi:hypothetical protein
MFLHGISRHRKTRLAPPRCFHGFRNRRAADSARPTINKLREAARDCRACPLWKTGTQTVFGDGSRSARVVFVGEQPGNEKISRAKLLSAWLENFWTKRSWKPAFGATTFT